MAEPSQEGSKRKRKRAAIVWDYFSYEGQCNKCKRFYKADSKRDGTSGVRNHLKCKHPELYAQLIEKEEAKRAREEKKQETRRGTGGEDGDGVVQCGTQDKEEENGDRRAGIGGRVQRVQAKKAHEDAAPVPAPSRPVGSSGGEPGLEEGTRHLAQLFVKRGYDPSLLDEECFRIFLRSVNPEYNLPTRDAMSGMCDGIIAEEQEYLKAKLRSSPGRVTLALGRIQTIRGEAIYTACHFIDKEWKLHRVLLDVYVVAPTIGYHDPLIGVNEVTPQMLPERVVADCLELGITPENLYRMAGEKTDGFQSRIIGEIKTQLMEERNNGLNQGTTYCMGKAHETDATYMDSVLHSTARCLVLDQEFTDEVFGDVQIYNMNRTKRERLFSLLRLDSPLEYGEKWYSWYCTLTTMHRVGLNAVEGSESFVGLVCKVWGKIHRAIQRISTPSCPASDLGPVLLKVSDALEAEIDNADVSHKFKGFQGVRTVVDVLREAKDSLDKAIQDSYMLWSIPLAFDPRHKLTTPIFESVFGSKEAAENKIADVKGKMHDLYTDYAQGGNELECYLEDDAAPQTEAFFDVLDWWKDHGIKRYPTVAQMARNVLATPMCGRLPSEKMATVSSIVRGYTQEKHIRPEQEADNDVEQQQETAEVVDGDLEEKVSSQKNITQKVMDIIVKQDGMMHKTGRRMEQVIMKSYQLMEKRIASLEREVRSGRQHQAAFKSNTGTSDVPADNDESLLKNSQEYEKTVGKDKPPEKIRPSSEKRSKPINDKNDAYNYHQTPISIQDFRCTKQDKATKEYIDSSRDEQRLVIIKDIVLEANDLKKITQQDTWIKDCIIKAYISCLREDDHLRNRDHGKVYLVYPVFTQHLKDHGTNLRERGDAKFVSWVQEQAKEYLKHDMVFLPINITNSHWYLAVINTKLKMIQVLDSLGPNKNHDEREELTTTLIGLESYMENIPEHIRSKQHKWPDFKFTSSSWKVRDEVEREMQTDRSSCGLFMLKYMECWTGTKLSPNFTQEDIDAFRQKLPVLLVDSKHNLTPGGPKSSQTDSKGNDLKDPINLD